MFRGHSKYRLAVQVVLLLVSFIYTPLESRQSRAQDSADTKTAQSVTGRRSALRIVSGYSGLTDILTALGVADMVVGVTGTDKVHGQWKDVESVGNHHRPDLEVITSLKPDLVLLSDQVDEGVVIALTASQIPHREISMESIDQLLQAILDVASLVDRRQEGAEIVRAFTERLQQIREHTATLRDDQRPTVFFELRFSPSLVTKGRGSLVDEIIEIAGGRNVVSAPESTVSYSVEQLLSHPPDIYIIQLGAMNPSGDLRERSILAGTPAFRRGLVFTVEDSLFSRPSPRTIEAIEYLHSIIFSNQSERGRGQGQ